MFKPLTLSIVLVLTAGCTRSITSEPGDAPNLEKWTKSIQDKKPSGKKEALPTLNKFEVFSYKDHVVKVYDPNPTSATLRAEVTQTTPSETSSTDGSSSTTQETTTQETTTPVVVAASPEKTYLRNPFALPEQQDSGDGLRPDPNRPKQPLEAYALDSLKMVGTIGPGSRTGLIMTPEKVTHRVNVGQYLGTQDGRVVDVSSNQILLIELVPDGQGGWEEREASLVLE